MFSQFQYILQHNCQIVVNKPLLVGVSGGPDSLCLLDLLAGLGLPVVVAHFNHLLRPESTEETENVRTLAEDRGVPFVQGSGSVAEFASSHGQSLEEAGRELRYQFLFAQARLHDAQAVTVAHTADDQAETVLMHLLRGAGSDGLKGMTYRSLPNPWSGEIPLVRPLLAISREQVLAYNIEHNLRAFEDSTNLDRRFTRNRIRHEIIPTIERYAPGLRQRLWRTADILQAESQFLDGLVSQTWPICVLDQSESYLELSDAAFASQPLSIQRRLLRKAIATLLPGLRNLDYDAIERGRGFLLDIHHPGRCILVGGLSLVRVKHRVWLLSLRTEIPSDSWPQMPGGDAIRLEIPGALALMGDWVLRAQAPEEVKDQREVIFHNADPYQAWLDAGMVGDRLIVRTRLPGDRFLPMGMAGHSMKISDLMVNAKIPRHARKHWPLVCIEAGIVWVPGYRVGELASLRMDTKWMISVSVSLKTA